VFLQQLQILFLKGFLPVMLPLILDVCNYLRNLGFADGESTVTILPFKEPQI